MRSVLHVLYAEDHAVDADLTRSHFERTAPEFRFEVVHRARDFLPLARTRRYAALLVDPRLPDLDGFEVLKILAREGIDTPVILVTREGDPELASRALRLGADDCVSKRPGYLEALPKNLREVIDRRHRQPRTRRAPRAQPRHILLVPGPQTDAAALTGQLAAFAPHLTIEVATTADAALARLESGTDFDLVIGDHHPPAFNALELVAATRESPRRHPFLLLTDHGREDQVVAAFKLGASDCVFRHAHYAAELALRIDLAIDRHELLLANEHTSARLQLLSRRLLAVQEAERRHLARELHDEIGQILTVAKIHLQSAAFAAQTTVVAAGIKEPIALLDRLLAQVRSLSLDLRPPLLDDLGVVHALHWLLQQPQAHGQGPHVQFTSDPTLRRYDPALETACFRIAQEAVTNALRHSQARNINLSLAEHNGALRLVVRDDGTGFDAAAARARAESGSSLGLLGMDERAQLAGGTLSLLSAPGRGTEIEAVFPLSKPSETT